MARHSRFRSCFSFLWAVTLITLFNVGSSNGALAQPAPPTGNSAKLSTPEPAIFQVAPAISISGAPSSVAAGDLNGDGKLDLVVANASAGKVTVLLGKGNGQFGAPVEYAVGKQPASVLLGDFNGDGKLDVVVCNEADGTLSVLLGNGDGTLQKPATYQVVLDPLYVAMGDLNGDGKPDLVVAGGASQTIAVLLNDGTGNFAKAVPYNLGRSPLSLAVADFDGDSHLDIASANTDGTVSILFGRGDGTVRKISSVAVGSAPLSSIVAGDFNNDGKSDLAVTQSGTKLLTVLLGTGNGTFQKGSSYQAGSNPAFVIATDLHGDGNADLMTANQSGNTFSVLLGNGDGTFQSALDFAVGNSPRAVAAGDFNGDGKADLAIVNFSDKSVSVPLGNGDGTFKAARSYNADLERKAVAVGDLDGDGKLDLVVTNYCGTDSSCAGNGTVNVFLANGDGSYRAAGGYPLGAGPLSVALADLNGDKKLDLIAVNRGDKTVSVLLGNGDGTFQSALSYPLAGSPLALAVGDFNKDGKIDLAITTDCGSSQCAQPGQLNILLGNGDSSFQPAATYTVGYSPASVAIGDVDGDGSPDVVVANACGQDGTCKSKGTASVLIGDAKGGFKSLADIALGNSPSSIALGDLAGRKILDLVVAHRGDNKVAVLQGNGDGSFKTPVSYPVGTAPASVIVADFNGDGKPDVAAANLKDSTISVLLGNGNGTLQPAAVYPAGAGPQSLAAVSPQGKGHADLVAANGNGGATPMGSSVTVLASVLPLAGTDVSTTAIALTTGPNPSNYGASLKFTATVSGDGVHGSPTGTVAFTDNGSSIDPSCNTVNLTTVSGNTETAMCTTTLLTAGTHSSLVATYSGDPTYAISSGTLTPAQVVHPITVTASVTASNKTYDGTIAATTVCTPNVLPVDVGKVTCAAASASFATANVGTGITVTAAGITLGGAQAANYVLSPTTATTTANITQAPVTATAGSFSGTYDGSPHSPSACVVTGTYTGNLTCSNSPSSVGPAVGSGMVTPTVSGTGLTNFNINPVNGTWSITQGTVTASVTANNKPYDGTTAATIASCTVNGLMPVDIGKVTCSAGSASFASPNAGTGIAVTATGITLGGTAAGNYTLSPTTATTFANITAITATASVTANNKTYDATTGATIATCNLTGVLPVDAGKVTCSASSASFATPIVGTGITVTANITLGGTSAGNYMLSLPTATTTANITAAAVTPIVAAANKTYDGTAAATITSCTLSGVVPADTGKVTCSVGSASFPSANVGAGVTVTASGITLGGSASTNYTLTSTTATTTANITPIILTASVMAANKLYDGTTVATITACTLSGVLAVDTGKVTCSPTSASFASASAGTGIAVTAIGLTLGGSSAGNYALSSTSAATTANITPVTVTASVMADNKIYDGTTAATINTCTLSGVLPLDSGKVNCSSASASFASSGVGTGITVTATGITLVGTAAGNYSLSSTTATTTANITQASPVFTNLTASQSIVYGTSSINLSGVIVAPGKVYPPAGEKVSITINGTTIPVTINTNGAFGAPFSTATILGSTTAYVITYGYVGDSNFSAAPSDTSTTLTVNAYTSVPTLALVGGRNPAASTEALTFNANVKGVSNRAPTGHVTFNDVVNGVSTLICTSALSTISGTVNSLATCTSSVLPVGVSSVVASYIGDTNYAPSNSTALSQTVQDFAISSSPASAVNVTQGYSNTSNPFASLQVGMSVTTGPASTLGFSDALGLTCAVVPLAGQSTTTVPTCVLTPSTTSTNVTCDVTTKICTIAGGTGTVAVTVSATSSTSLGLFRVDVTATDQVLVPSTLSHLASLFVNVVNNTAAVNVLPGGVGNTTAAFTGPINETINITFTSASCVLVTGSGLNVSIPPSGEPPSTIGMSCTISPGTLTLTGTSTAGGTGSVTVSVNTSTAAVAALRKSTGILAAVWLGLPGMVLLGSLRNKPRSRKTVLQFFGMLLVLIALLQGIGCGGGFTRQPTVTGTPTGAYQVLVQATGNDGLTYSAIVPVNVGH